jgi:hypothetical protein
MQRWKSILSIIALAFTASFFSFAQAQEPYRPYPPPTRPMFLLGMAHVDGPTDHDDIRVGRYAGRFHSIVLQVRYAPIQFDHVVIHYGDGYAQPLPVNAFIPDGGSSQRIVLPGGRRVISSLELWYARANPRDPRKPEIQLFGQP